MGCWNETCFLSNLPILAGERIVLIPLISSFGIESGKTCEVTDNYAPLGFTFKGKYDDYGGIREYTTESIFKDFLSRGKIQRMQAHDVTENECIEAFRHSRFKTAEDVFTQLIKAEKVQYENPDNFLDDLTRGSLCYGVRKLPLNCVMIHEELYQAVIKEVGERIPFGKTKTFRELWKENIINFRAKKNHDKEVWKELGMDIVPCISSPSRELSVPGANSCYDFMVSKILEGRDELIDPLIDSIMLTSAVSLLRKGYLCLSGAGSQSQEYKLHILLADFIKKKAEEHKNTEESLFWWGRSE